MNRYQQLNAAFKISGYFTPRAWEGDEDAFIRAKAECLNNLAQEMAHVEALGHRDFLSMMKKPAEVPA